MARKIVFVVLLILCVLWVSFIFSNSLKDATASDSQSAGVTEKVNEVAQAVGIDREITHSEVRSMAHFSEFAILALLVSATVSVGIYPYFKEKLLYSMLISSASLPLCLILAIIDELLQKLSEGRASQLTDVLLDTLGALCGALLFAVAYIVFYSIKEKFKEKQK